MNWCRIIGHNWSAPERTGTAGFGKPRYTCDRCGGTHTNRGIRKPSRWKNADYNDTDSMTETTLKEVKWQEESEITEEIATSRVVWPGGAEREVRHINVGFPHGWRDNMIDENGDPTQLDIRTEPAFIEEIAVEERTRTKTNTRYAWVSEVPPGVETTGEEKTVRDTEGQD